jgi:hypothetical protein
MADKGIKSKRRWSQWLGYIGSFIGAIMAVAPEIAPAAAVAYPQYAIPIRLGGVGITALSAELARRSKNAEPNKELLERLQDATDNQATGTTQEVASEDAE